MGPGDIIEVRVPPDGADLVIVARKPGTTSVLLILDTGDKVHYTVQVTPVK